MNEWMNIAENIRKLVWADRGLLDSGGEEDL